MHLTVCDICHEHWKRQMESHWINSVRHFRTNRSCLFRTDRYCLKIKMEVVQSRTCLLILTGHRHGIPMTNPKFCIFVDTELNYASLKFGPNIWKLARNHFETCTRIHAKFIVATTYVYYVIWPLNEVWMTELLRIVACVLALDV